MAGMTMRWGGLGLILFVAGCAFHSASSESPPKSETQWVTFPDEAGDRGIGLEEYLKKHPLPPQEERALHLISRSNSSSSHLVVIRKEEKLHTHQTHDAVAILLKGHGILTLGRRQLYIKPGAVVTIPRGTPHAFSNRAEEPAVAYVVFVPAFDGEDFHPVETESASSLGHSQ